MVIDLGALNQIITDYVIEPFDHTFLNKDVAFFNQVVQTAENIALYISNTLRSPIQELGATLYKVKLVESPNNACEIYAADSESISVNTAVSQPVLAIV